MFEGIINSIDELERLLNVKINPSDKIEFRRKVDEVGSKMRELGPIEGEDYYDLKKMREFSDFATYFKTEPKMMTSLYLIDHIMVLCDIINNMNDHASTVVYYCDSIYVEMYRIIGKDFYPITSIKPGTLLIEVNPYDCEMIRIKPNFKADYYYLTDSADDDAVMLDTPYTISCKNGQVTLTLPETMFEVGKAGTDFRLDFEVNRDGLKMTKTKFNVKVIYNCAIFTFH